VVNGTSVLRQSRWRHDASDMSVQAPTPVDWFALGERAKCGVHPLLDRPAFGAPERLGLHTRAIEELRSRFVVGQDQRG
jgi:hypothetical protein